MFTWTMSWPERQAEYLRDIQVFDGRRPYVEAALKKRLKHKNGITFPYTEVMEVTTKYHNRYLWFMKFPDKKALKQFSYQEMMFALIQGARGLYVYGCFDHRTPYLTCRAIMFAPHFFSRYAKRTHQTFPDIMECRKTFLSRNFPCVVNKGIKTDDEGKTEYTAFAPCPEGVGLGNYDAEYKRCVLFKTFITHNMLKGTQTEAADKGLKSIEMMKELEQILINKSNCATEDFGADWIRGIKS